MSTNKRCISRLFTLVILLGLLPQFFQVVSTATMLDMPLHESNTQLEKFSSNNTIASPRSIESEDGFWYEVSEDAEGNAFCVITSYGGTESHITIPAEINGVPVTRIDRWAFSNASLESIFLPDSIKIIDDWAFSSSSITTIRMPTSLVYLGDYAFWSCQKLKSIVIPLGISEINSTIFEYCVSLESITLSSSVISFFEGDQNNSLDEINVDSDNPVYCSIDGVLFNKDATTLLSYPNGKAGSYTIPDSVTSLQSYSFSACRKLICVTIPVGVTSIGDNAFYLCSGLTEIQVSDKNEAYCSQDGVLYNKDMTILLCCPGGKQGVVTIPHSVTGISPEALRGCTNLIEIAFRGNAPSIGSYSFGEVTATAYYPVGNPTWTDDVMQNYGGNLTWVPYTPDDIDPPAPSVDTHDTLDQLTELDYLAFSELAYSNLDSAVDDYLTEANESKRVKEYLAGKWDDKWHDNAFTYADVYGGIANWVPIRVDSFDNGFYAVVFKNANEEFVIAYRGSKGFGYVFDGDNDAIYDWLVNDLPMQILDQIIVNNQLQNALNIYNDIATFYDKSHIAVTGHSLGGGLADMVSAYSGCRGVTMNAISVLDVVYSRMPETFVQTFDGVDAWNFEDHTNQYDLLAGMWEYWQSGIFVSVRTKPYIAHKNTSGGFNALDLVTYHDMASFVTQKSNGTVDLTEEDSSFSPMKPISQKINEVYALYLDYDSYLDLGTTGNDSFSSGLTQMNYRVMYGGDGCDTLNGSSVADTLIGGALSDDLDGSRGDDTYIYYKGDGVDTIHDIGGNDKLVLMGFEEDDTFSVLEDYGDDYIHVRSGGETIVKISKKNREYVLVSLDSFKIIVDSGSDDINDEVYDITDAFYKYTYGEHLYIACPVHVEVLDADGNVVYTLTDGEVGSWYTDYGNFYVFEEENGEYGKVLDLVEGYSARIVGADEGTMDVTYQVPVDGELSDPVSVSGVPVTENLSATIEENEDGNVYLVIDEDNDGETDSERRLCGECPFTDVPKDSFYYEPVLWAVKEGITNGATETTYNPDGTCLRAQVVAFLHRTADNPEPTSTRNPFTDVKSGDFFYKPVLWAVEQGITNGTGSATFGSYDVCNRAAVVTFLWRAAGSPEPESTDNPFTDVKSSDFFYKPVLWAIENGITNGVDATHFGPTSPCNRAQVVTFLYRAYN